MEQIYLACYETNLLDEDYVLGWNPEWNGCMGPLNKVNLFTGANNSGKSRVLRRLAWNNLPLYFQNSPENLHSRRDRINDLRNRLLENGLARIRIVVIHGALDFLEDEKPDQFALLINWIKNGLFQRVQPGQSVILNIFDILSGVFIGELAKTKEALETKETQYKLGVLRPDVCLQGLEFLFWLIDKGEQGASFQTKGKARTFFQWENAALKEEDLEVFGLLIEELKYWGQSQTELVTNLQSTYVSTLRSLYSLIGSSGERINEDIYLRTIQESYSEYWVNREEGSSQIFTGQRIYWDVLKARNGGFSKRKNLEAFEDFLSYSFWGGKPVAITALMDLNQMQNRYVENSRNQHHITITIGDEERPIHQVGDGIQAIIMLTFPIFMAQEGAMIFIEEPETHLHPGLQRLFLEVLLTNEAIKAKNLTFFITTHSNHLVDLSLDKTQDLSIFTFRHDDTTGKKIVKNVHSGDPDLLSLLGVQNSSVFLANCSVWVEGITDRKYISAYLQAYLRHLEEEHSLLEDLDFAFFEYAGSNLSHYLFKQPDETWDGLSKERIHALRLSNRILVIADQDKEKQKKHHFLSSQQGGQFEYYYFKHALEVENLLDPATLKRTVVSRFKKAGKDIARWDALKHNDYMAMPLGKFLIETWGKSLPQKTFKDAGTLPSSCKLEFCKIACAEPFKWETMTEEAQELAKVVYNFIQASRRPKG